MDQEAVYQSLLRTTQTAYAENPEMTGFTPFPDDIGRQAVTPFHSTCCDVFCEDKKLVSQRYGVLQDAIRAASNAVHWRETYKDTEIGADFMDRFACYCIIGENAPFMSAAIRLFMVYMPCHFYYPWHQHPAEEMYMVVSGNGVFKRKGCPDERLTEGCTSFHESNQPHALETLDDPVLCLVAWRDDFEMPPVLTPPSEMS